MRITCPKCEGLPKAVDTIFGVKLECCGLWSWGNKELVDAETHKARQTAHFFFDKTWRTGKMSRSAAYRALAREMKMKTRECHISYFDKDQCAKAIAFASQLENGD